MGITRFSCYGKYQDVQGMSLSELGFTAWMPYTALGLGTVIGGLAPKMLIEKTGWSLNRARKTMMLSASIAIPLACMCLLKDTSPLLATGLISGIMFAHGLWGNITIPAETFPAKVQATITGIGGTLEGLMGVLSQKAIGEVIGTYSYLPIFVYIGSAYIISYACVCLTVGRLGKIRQLK